MNLRIQVSDITQTDSLRGIEDFTGISVAAVLGFAKFDFSNFSVSVEHVATDQFDETIIVPENNRLQASHVEFVFESLLAGKLTHYSVAYSASEDAAFLEIPESRYSLGTSIAFSEKTYVVVEAFTSDAYQKSDGTSGIDETGLLIRAGLKLD